MDSALVHITKIASIILTPDPVILQVGQTQQMTATAKDNYDNVVPLPASAYNWSVTGTMGSITASGNFTALTQGNGSIIAEYDSVTGSVPVQVGASTYVMVDDFTVVTGYTLGGTSINLAQCSFTRDTSIYVSAPSSGKLHYVFTTGGTTTLDVKKNIPISGTPDKVGINVYGDGRGHWLRGEFKDVDNERFLIDFTAATPGIDWTDEWQYIEKPFSAAVPSWANPTAVLTFPVTWMRIYMAETSDAKKDSGTIYFDDFKVHFIATSVEDEESIPQQYGLDQNYPNPFNPSTVISYSIPGLSFVSLKIYDILGKEISALVNEVQPAGNYQINFAADNLPAGVYFYRINAGNFNQTKKMVLLK
jgi:hypothetical protein